LERQCTGITRDGQQCTRTVNGPRGYCWLHDPAHARERSRYASVGGRTKPSSEVYRLKEELRDLREGVLSGQVERNDAAVVIQIARVIKDLIELERRIKETEEFEARLAALEGGSHAG
jgi:hypothetical protein